jgi:geranylgeranyl diphosphate synthase type II
MHRPEFFQRLIEDEIQKLSFPAEPADLYDPIRYMMTLGGKRLRPALLLMAHELFGGNPHNAIKPALAIEVFHNFTLLHDDIMDKAPLRRGKPTVHEKWNPDIAILSGDTLFVKACELMMGVEDTWLRQAFTLFYHSAAEVCEGQQLDMHYETSDDVHVNDYLGMIGSKTAALLACSLTIGALTAGASLKDQSHIYSFGKNLGIAFQLHDDVLDVYGDEKKFGKKTGGDILSNKKTFLLLSAMQVARGSIHKELQQWMMSQDFDPDEKVKAVKNFYSVLGIRELAETEMEKYFQAALRDLESIEVDEEKKSVLREFASQLMLREA